MSLAYLFLNADAMESLDALIRHQENHLNELENLKHSLKKKSPQHHSDSTGIPSDIREELEQIEREIETIYREISVLKIRRLMNVS